MCDCGCCATQPWWRPNSVAWIVVTYGRRRRVATAAAAAATSQSCPCTTSTSGSAAAASTMRVVQRVDPAQERVEVARRRGAGDAVDQDAGAQLGRGVAGAAARDDVDRVALRREALRELADVAREPALDDRRVLPREDEHATAHGRA